MPAEFSTTTKRNCTFEVIKATLLYHSHDLATHVRQEHGSLDWALSYASTYFDRGEWTKEKVRVIEVVVLGEVIATVRPR
jgi:tRNA G37 N-methylase Trm5